VSRRVVRRFVAGATDDEAIAATRALLGAGLRVSIDYLGEDTTEVSQADAATKTYLTLLGRLADAKLVPAAEVSVKLSALGQAIDPQMAVGNAHLVCAAARRAGTTVTFDAEDHRGVDATLAALGELRRDFPETGAVVQAALRRTEGDCRDLATAGSRVRLCKGAYDEPATVAYRRKGEVDASYRRCLAILVGGDGYPMIATHDPALIALAGRLDAEHGRKPGSYEYQLLYGVRPAEQRRLAAAGETVRVYLPYGEAWYSYLVRRLAERPANVGFFLRAIASRG
jgi:proline dehydrogenase